MWKVHGTPMLDSIHQEFQATVASALRENGEESKEGIHTHGAVERAVQAVARVALAKGSLATKVTSRTNQ